MGYVLLWIENLALDLLFVAMLVACIARLKSPRLRVALSLLVALPSLVGRLLLVGLLAFLYMEQRLDGGLLYPWTFSSVCFLVGVAWILFAGLRRRGDAPAVRAATWPRGKLAIVFAVGMALHLMTFWNLDLAVRQQLATLKAEAGAMALSVAPAHLSDRDNAALIYEQTYEAFDPASWPEDRSKKWKRWTDDDAPKLDLNDPDLRSLLDEQAPTIELLRQAAEKPGCHFGRDYGFPSIDWELPELQKLRDAARLLALDAQYRASQGDMQTAMEDIDTMFKIAAHVGAEPILISGLMACAIDAKASQTLQEVLAKGHLQEDQKITAEQLQTIDLDGSLSFQRLCRRSFRLEMAFAVSTIGAVSTDPEWDLLWDELAVDGPPPTIARVFYRVFLATEDAASYRALMGQMMQIAAKPYHEAKPEWEELEEEEIRSKPMGIFTSMLLPALSKAAEVFARADAQHRATRLALAAERFRAEKGELPKTLDELAPDYIPILPPDPFDGKSMKYRVTDDGATIYSIGPDGEDDNGTPWNKNAKTGDMTFELSK